MFLEAILLHQITKLIPEKTNINNFYLLLEGKHFELII